MHASLYAGGLSRCTSDKYKDLLSQQCGLKMEHVPEEVLKPYLDNVRNPEALLAWAKTWGLLKHPAILDRLQNLQHIEEPNARTVKQGKVQGGVQAVPLDKIAEPKETHLVRPGSTLHQGVKRLQGMVHEPSKIRRVESGPSSSKGTQKERETSLHNIFSAAAPTEEHENIPSSEELESPHLPPPQEPEREDLPHQEGSQSPATPDDKDDGEKDLSISQTSASAPTEHENIPLSEELENPDLPPPQEPEREGLPHLEGSQSPATQDESRKPYVEKPGQAKTYTIRTRGQKTFKKKVIEETIHEITFDPLLLGRRVRDAETEIRNMFQELIDSKFEDERDLGRVYIEHKDLMNPILISPTPMGELTAGLIMGEIDRVLQSAESLTIDASFIIHFAVLRSLPGGRGGKHKALCLKEDLKTKNSILYIESRDRLCAARAIVLGYHYMLSKERDVEACRIYNSIRRNKKKLSSMALSLHAKAGLDTGKAATIADLAKFESLLDVTLVVLSTLHSNDILYKGQEKRAGKIYLLLVLESNARIGHYHVITNVKGYLGVPHYCEICEKGFMHKRNHPCTRWCDSCMTDGCYPQGDNIMCQDCGVLCLSMACYLQHKEDRLKAPSPCDSYHICSKCGKKGVREYMLQKHSCGEYFCKICRTMVHSGHQCFMRRPRVQPPRDKIIFYDFECMQDTGYHIPNLAVLRICCRECTSLDYNDICNRCGNRCASCNGWDIHRECYTKARACTTSELCGQRVMVFKGSRTVEDLCTWIFNKRRRGTVVIAHNNAGYDGMFILNWLVHNGHTPKVLFRGSKLITAELKSHRITLIDSLSFLSFSLEDFPRTLGFPELSKGFFPYLFNTKENEGYVGPMPPIHFFNPGGMKDGRRKEFEMWYNENKHSTIHVWDMMEEYCRLDVQVLCTGVLIFRDMCLQVTRFLDPLNYCTSPSFCMAMYRYMFLKENWMMKLEGKDVWSPVTVQGDRMMLNEDKGRVLAPSEIHSMRFIDSPIAVTNHFCNGRGGHFSKESIQWLSWLEEDSRRKGKVLNIQHALKGGEKEVSHPGGTWRLDGYSEVDKKRVAYEYFGDYWHGCSHCYPKLRTKESTALLDMRQREEATQHRVRMLKDMGFQVVSIWGHEWKETVSKDPAIKDYIDSLDIQDRLSPREAFYGGRTEVMRLYYEATANTRVRYLDFNTLYSSILFYCLMPVGNPIVLTRDLHTLDGFFGLAKVHVLPPHDSYIPVLPVRVGGRLLFPLCFSCATSKSGPPCSHSDAERSFVGTWCTLEIQKAVSQGYKVLHIYEVYHWTRQSKTLFKDYIKYFIRLKEEASGYPAWVKTEKEKETFIADYKHRLGIALRPDKMKKNKGMRGMAKLSLNSFWGKFGQGLHQTSYEILREAKDVYKIMTDTSKILKDFHIIDEDVASLEWQRKGEFPGNVASANIYIAIFTTCHARLALLDMLEVPNIQVVYCDTDSCVYWEYIDRPLTMPEGPYLGQVKDELTCDSVGCRGCTNKHYITKIVCAGPKNYAYEVDTGYTVCKIRGFTLTSDNADVLNFDSLSAMVKSGAGTDPIATYHFQIRRNKKTFQITSKQEKRIYTMSYNKRAIVQDYNTLPFGYKA